MTTTKTMAEVPTFERDGGAMPILGLGTFETIGASCTSAVRVALEAGYRHLDTARMYKNEKEVGQGIKDSGVDRASIFLTTKLKMGQLDPEGVRASCENSLRALDTDYVDLLLIHWPEPDTPLQDTLKAMSDLKHQGKIRHLGVSNFTVELLRQAVSAAEAPLFCNQIEFHPYIDQRPPLRFCREQGMAVVAYSPLARGEVIKDVRLAKIGEKHGKSAAQVALRWIVDQPGVIAIPKGSSAAHIQDNFDIFDFDLDEEDRSAINGFKRNRRLIDPAWAPEWDTWQCS